MPLELAQLIAEAAVENDTSRVGELLKLNSGTERGALLCGALSIAVVRGHNETGRYFGNIFAGAYRFVPISGMLPLAAQALTWRMIAAAELLVMEGASSVMPCVVGAGPQTNSFCEVHIEEGMAKHLHLSAAAWCSCRYAEYTPLQLAALTLNPKMHKLLLESAHLPLDNALRYGRPEKLVRCCLQAADVGSHAVVASQILQCAAVAEEELMWMHIMLRVLDSDLWESAGVCELIKLQMPPLSDNPSLLVRAIGALMSALSHVGRAGRLDKMLRVLKHTFEQRFSPAPLSWQAIIDACAPNAEPAAASLLLQAVYAGNMEHCRVLMQHGAFIWGHAFRTAPGHWPVVAAFRRGDLPMARLLLSEAASEDKLAFFGGDESSDHGPVVQKTMHRSFQVVESLFASPAQPERAELSQLLSLLSQHTVAVTKRRQDQCSPLMLAYKLGYAAGVQALTGPHVAQQAEQVSSL
ncbi:hypothetical protein MMC07_000380 [Pseudocyphellaria aurata]|nr:hypothetical protein [Pseudocyphellaria aurata]